MRPSLVFKMRIVGGTHRGRKLVAPADDRVRPTSDRVREALFNILSHNRPSLPSGARVLDLFAGTGAFGLEALSRGAAHVTFVDSAPSSLKLVRDNADTLGLRDDCTIMRRDAAALPKADQPVGLVFADPPYGKDLIAPALASAHKGGWIGPDTIILVETAAEEDLTLDSPFQFEKHWTYGQTKIWRFTLAA